MSEIKTIFVPQFKCNVDDVMAVSIISESTIRMFMGVNIGLKSGNSYVIYPQSAAAEVVKQLKDGGFYTEEEYNTTRAYIDRLWDGKTDVTPGQLQQQAAQAAQRGIMVPKNLKH